MKKTIIAGLLTLVVAGCGGGDCSGPDCKVRSFDALYTTAPPAVTISAGETTNYVIGGGTSPYSVSSSDPKIVTAVVTGPTLKLTGVSGGQGIVSIVDSAGKTITLAVTIAAKGMQTTPPPTIFPSSITIGDCTTNVPFTFTGGVGPFTVYTSDNFEAPVSAAQPLGSQDYFFTASVKLPDNRQEPANITLTVLDSQSRTATATIIPGPNKTSCPTNPVLQTFPASANVRVSEVVSFQISGGKPPYNIMSINQPSAVSAGVTENIATVRTPLAIFNPADQKYYFEVQGTSTGNTSDTVTGAALVTVTDSEQQKVNIVFTVYPRQ